MRLNISDVSCHDPAIDTRDPYRDAWRHMMRYDSLITVMFHRCPGSKERQMATSVEPQNACSCRSERPHNPRRGSETRRRTQQIKLSLLPDEQQRLQALAQGRGFASVQAYILDRLKSDFVAS